MSTATATNGPRKFLLREVPEVQRYDIRRAMKMALAGEAFDGLELEVHQELAKHARGERECLSSRFGSSFIVPLSAVLPSLERRDLTSSTGAGAMANVTDRRPASFIDVLRSQSLALRFGATLMDDASGSSFSIPKKTASASVGWVSESNAPAEGSPTIGSVLVQPHTQGTHIDITRSLRKQSGDAVVDIVTMDLAGAMAAELDRVALAGEGSSATPEGLIYNADVPVQGLGTNGGTLDLADVVAIEKELADNNGDADTGRLGWLAAPAVRAKLRQTEGLTGSGLPIWGNDQRILGWPAGATNNLPSNLTKGSSGATLSALIFGNWADLLLVTWGSATIQINPYGQGTAGTWKVTALLDCDVNVRHADSFQIVKDIITT